MTKSGRTVIFEDLKKFLMIYKDNNNTNRCSISSMVNHIFQWRTIIKPPNNNFPQIIPKCSINVMILIHNQTDNTRQNASQAINLKLVNHLLQFPLLRPNKNQKPVQKETKGVRYERDWSSEKTAQLIDLWCSRPVLNNTWLSEYMDKNKKSQAIKKISDEMGVAQDLIVKKMSSLRIVETKMLVF